jgi:hypothetical protein
MTSATLETFPLLFHSHTMDLCALYNGLTVEKLWPPNYYEHATNLAVLEALRKTVACARC